MIGNNAGQKFSSLDHHKNIGMPSTAGKKRNYMKVKIDPEGTLHFLYADDHPLLELGKHNVVRASKVEFDNTLGAWVIIVPEFGTYGKWSPLPESYSRRADALAAEKKFLEDKMAL